MYFFFYLVDLRFGIGWIVNRREDNNFLWSENDVLFCFFKYIYIYFLRGVLYLVLDYEYCKIDYINYLFICFCGVWDCEYN